MKKIIATFCTLSLLIGALAGCSATSETQSTTSADTSAEETTAETAGGSTAGTAEETEIQVFIAASLSEAMTEIAAEYNKEHPEVTITYNADSSGTLMQQIEEGFECDLFFSASTDEVDELNEQGYVMDGSIKQLLENSVVLISAKDSGTAVTGFENITDAANLALAGESVPVGKYSREIFTNLGIYDDVMSMEINECKNVTAVKEAVKEGANEVGTVYYSDAYSVKDDVDIIASADSSLLDTPIIYPAALIKNDQADEAQTAAAEAFLEYLSSDTAKQIFSDYMFIIHEE
ncbi:MAG TPA: molybdate ABC transporter substrate-binding protein [Candidatus Onthocola gallistercoris]|uniref:Molybdate-binding protein ModA n=1 Tax=Candidatus Onthocola gallistercoris TaxID=2840876 RepID=A0A9D1HJP7_9FIRM|nr:molybdate ABC transporter substrate-binding protein [Candidatus Onthocola gallistercoris]